jgi:hypothetical protein
MTIREDVELESLYTTENRERKKSVSLGGVAETVSGKLTKSNYFRFLGHDLDDYSNIQFTKEEAQKIHHHLAKLSTGSTAVVPLYCGGDICPFRDRCPLYTMEKHPLGKLCPIENHLLKEYTIRYFEEFDIDPQNWTEVGYVNELAEIDIYLTRLKYILARPVNSELIIDQVVGFSGQEQIPVIQKQLSPYMDQMEKLNNRKSKIIKLMVGDRQEKYKKEAALKIAPVEDPSKRQAAMRAKLEALQRALDATPTPETKVLTPEDLINQIDPEDG